MAVIFFYFALWPTLKASTIKLNFDDLSRNRQERRAWAPLRETALQYSSRHGVTSKGVPVRRSPRRWHVWRVCVGPPNGECYILLLESDCALIVSKLGSTAEVRSEQSPIITEAKGLPRLFNSWRISQVKRDGNHLANTLARLARQCKHSPAWLGRAPTCAQSPINADCNYVPV